MQDAQFLAEARKQAQDSLNAAGVPVGAVLVRDGKVLGSGHNQRVQRGDPIAHGEMDCLRNVGRLADYRNTTLYTTLSPCMMCAGTIVQFGIRRVVVGENQTFGGNEQFMRDRGVQVVVLNDPACKSLMDEFIRRYPQVWKEDIGEVDEADQGRVAVRGPRGR
jgi:cytosine deaminase